MAWSKRAMLTSPADTAHEATPEPGRRGPSSDLPEQTQTVPASPALLLQEHLERAWSLEDDTSQRRWSPAMTIGFSLGASALLWAGLVGALRALL